MMGMSSLHDYLQLMLRKIFMVSKCSMLKFFKAHSYEITRFLIMQVGIAIFAFVVLFLFSFLSSFMLTSVNGIRFCDLLAKLIPLIDKL